MCFVWFVKMFDKLPEELQLLIFKKLPLSSMYCILTTSKQVSRVADDWEVWRSFLYSPPPPADLYKFTCRLMCRTDQLKTKKRKMKSDLMKMKRRKYLYLDWMDWRMEPNIGNGGAMTSR